MEKVYYWLRCKPLSVIFCTIAAWKKHQVVRYHINPDKDPCSSKRPCLFLKNIDTNTLLFDFGNYGFTQKTPC